MRNKGNGHYRAMILKLYMELNLSQQTRMKISAMIGCYEEDKRETRAKDTLDLIKDCKDEQDILETLNI